MNDFIRLRLPLIISIAVFIYVLLRAIYVPPYGDELNTFFAYIQTGSFQPFYAHLDANNHVINSLFSHLFFKLFGESMIVLRLPNVLCFILYLYYAWKIQNMFQKKLVGICWFITMVASLYFIEFFSLSRGYGMSMAFLLGGIYNLFSYSGSGASKNLLLGFFLISLALWSNLALMVLVLILGGIFIILFIKRANKSRNFKRTAVDVFFIISLFLIPLFYAIEYSIALKNGGHLYHGASSDFIQSVIIHLINEFSGSYILATKIFIILFTAYIAASIYSLVVKRLNIYLLLSQFLLWGTIIGTVLLHTKYGVNYPQNRTALHFFILFFIPFFFSIDAVNFKALLVFPVLISLLFIMQLVRTLNVSFVPAWINESAPYSFYKKLIQTQTQTGSLPTISGNPILVNVLNYYGFHNGGVLNTAQGSIAPSNVADFLIINKWDHISPIEYDTVLCERQTGVTLMRRRKLIEWKPSGIYPGDTHNSSEEYLSIITAPADTFIDYPFCFDVTFKVQADRFPLKCWIVTELKDEKGNSLSYDALDLQKARSDVRKVGFIHRKQYVEIVPKETKNICIYFWNVQKRLINISDLKVTLFKGVSPD